MPPGRSRTRSSPRIQSARSWRVNVTGDRLTEVEIVRPRRRQSACASSALGRTHSVSRLMRPMRSANGMNRAGDTSPRVGLCHRSSASAPTMAPVRESIWGWKTRESSPRSAALPRSASMARSSAVQRRAVGTPQDEWSPRRPPPAWHSPMRGATARVRRPRPTARSRSRRGRGAPPRRRPPRSVRTRPPVRRSQPPPPPYRWRDLGSRRRIPPDRWPRPGSGWTITSWSASILPMVATEGSTWPMFSIARRSNSVPAW
jgi:hypothetical protein